MSFSFDVGGTIRTENVNGFLFESGGNGFLTNKPDILELVKDCGAESLLLPSSDAARIRYIFTNRLHRLPETPVAFLRSELLGGVLWDSSIFADRAPPGCRSVRVMIGGQRNPLLALKEEPELIEIACGGVRETMGVTEAPDVTFVKRWDRGIPFTNTSLRT